MKDTLYLLLKLILGLIKATIFIIFVIFFTVIVLYSISELDDIFQFIIGTFFAAIILSIIESNHKTINHERREHNVRNM